MDNLNLDNLKNLSQEELAGSLASYSEKYYNKQESDIDDTMYDHIREELKRKNPDHPALKSVGAEVKTSTWPKVDLPFPAKSLDNAMDVEDFKKWTKKINYSGPFVVSAKMDGGSVIEVYGSGERLLSATRGDGKVGENITPQFNSVPVPLPVNDAAFPFNVRGEAVISKSNFAGYYKTDRFERDYANARNTACSMIRSPKGDLSRIEVLYYFLQDASGSSQSEAEMWGRLKTYGFKTAFHQVCENVNDVIEVYNLFVDSKRAEYEYEIDGLVVMVNDKEIQDRLGESDHHPNYGIAMKFPANKVRTKIESVTWELGDSGRFCPVAHVTPVSDGYATIRNITLHNFDYIINQKKIHIGDEVMVGRSGDVIPYIYHVVKDNGGDWPTPPINCPVCNSSVIKDGEFHLCPNLECQAKVLGRVYKWVENLNIKFAGEEMMRGLVENGTIKTVADIYRLESVDIERLTRMGPNHYLKMKKHIRLEITWPELLGSLSIPHFNMKTAEKFCEHFHVNDRNIGCLMRAVDSMRFDTYMGPTKTKYILDGLQRNSELISDLLSVISIKLPVQGSLTGMSFLFTGAAKDSDGNTLKRKDLEEMVKSQGGSVAGSVNSKLNYLVAEDKNTNSGKARKARVQGTEIISVPEFLEMV